jgi:pimeloyl-ACP methyl ester carboxylesterase
MQVIVDGLMTHYELQGKGKLLLYLHGWADSIKGSQQLRKELAKHFQVLAVDLPGFGVTQPPHEAWDLDGYAAFIEELLKKLNLAQPYAVVGHSNGGALAVRATALRKLEPQKLVLMAASGVRTGEAVKRNVYKIIAKTGKVATVWLPLRYRQVLRKRLYGAAGSDMLVTPQRQETFKRTVRQDVQADASLLQVQTLLIFARGDRAVPLADGETYHRLIKNSRLEVVDGAEHFVHLDQPEQVLALVEEFLR